MDRLVAPLSTLAFIWASGPSSKGTSAHASLRFEGGMQASCGSFQPPPPHISPRARCDVYSLTEKLNFAGSRADKTSVFAQTRQTKLIVGKSLILRYLAPLQSTAPSSEFNVDMTRAQEAKVNLRLSLSFGCRGFIGPWLTSTAFDAGELFFPSFRDPALPALKPCFCCSAS